MERLIFTKRTLDNQGEIGLLTVNRPKVLNALDESTLEELVQCLSDIEKESKLRCLIITGAGNAFVAGADIKGFPTMNEKDAQGFASKGQDVFRQLEKLKIPVIAAVNGFALGGGLELALSCDFIYSSQKAKFGLPEVTLGLIPGFGGTVRLSRLVGLAKARELIYRGDFIDAEEARSIGLVNKVFAPEELMAECQKTAELIASRGPIAIAEAKEVISGAYDVSIDQGMDLEKRAFSKLFTSDDQREGANAFIEKRRADFKGK